MNKRLEEILQRKEEIRSLLADETNKNINFDEIEKEIRRRQTIIDGMGTMITRTNTAKPVKTNIYDSEEYRQAFMNYVCRGEKIPQEFRSDEVTATTDIGALVPPVTLNKIIEKLEAYGMILPLVTRTAYKTGVAIPVSNVKPEATWVAEGAGSDKQKKTLSGTITFSHFKLRCAVAVTLETENMAYSAFETTLVNNVVEAMAKALEKAIIRAIKIHGVNFVKSLKLDEKYESIYDKVAKLGSIAENQLYTIKYCKIQDEIYSNIVDMRINLKRGSDIAIGSIGSLIGFILVQLFTNFGKLLNNIFIHVGISIFIMILFYILYAFV